MFRPNVNNVEIEKPVNDQNDSRPSWLICSANSRILTSDPSSQVSDKMKILFSELKWNLEKLMLHKFLIKRVVEIELKIIHRLFCSSNII